MKRRDFVRLTMAGAAALPFSGCQTANPPEEPADTRNPLFRVTGIPENAFTTGNRHAGVDTLIDLMGRNGLKFYRTSLAGSANGANGLIAADDIVLIKVNAQWKYRGCTNSRPRPGPHPAGPRASRGIPGRGRHRRERPGPRQSGLRHVELLRRLRVHANAQDESHSFLWLVNSLFHDPRVSAFLLDPIRATFIGAGDHATNGYRTFENVSYPCFTSAGGRRVELGRGSGAGRATPRTSSSSTSPCSSTTTRAARRSPGP